MRRVYPLLATIIIGLILNLVMFTSPYENPNSTIVTPIEIKTDPNWKQSDICASIGMPFSDRYKGIPFMSYYDKDFCAGSPSYFPIGIILNVLVAAGVSYGIFYVINRTRRK